MKNSALFQQDPQHAIARQYHHHSEQSEAETVRSFLSNVIFTESLCVFWREFPVSNDKCAWLHDAVSLIHCPREKD